MGVATVLNKFLEKVIKSDSTAGIYLSQLSTAFRFYLEYSSNESAISSSMFQPLIEMYLVSKDMDHEISRRRNAVLFRGISFQSSDVRELVDVITTGITNSPEATTKANNLAAKIFRES